MKVLIDTNVVLDVLLERQPFVENAIALFEQIELGNIAGAIAATTLTNIFYIIRKAESREAAISAVNRLLIGLQFCAVDRQTVETALSLGLKDFEDSIQLACALLNQLDGIVTRDSKDFIGSQLPIYSPTELLSQL
ncbi:PIN domain-containing protein [Acaryochloris sp. 'Moss Beach']|uniref:type II toxin-antitoxin system VapC family toxin n=1 Tax=Acaryochloris sp. 'Moss Beach' TaxID=2740837 RepID=UPI001F37925C|nr:PIN domain-containing protein [Acaryochloris sp. 'Moss Beach']UJB71131.1 PIN domain-containing protein [Acaryochloris sp. 'Moss Beach']